jgi:plastocyanin
VGLTTGEGSIMIEQFRARLMIQAVAGLAILAGCGGPTMAATTPAPAPVAAGQSMPGMSMPPVGAAGQDAPVATNTVAIQNFAFSPATVTVKAGTTITWTNRDSDAHTVTAMPAGSFHSPTLDTGQSFQYTFASPGRFDYLCTIHPFMTATVVVTP